MNDQRSLIDQLIDLIHLANKNGLYDAADYLKNVVDGVNIKFILMLDNKVIEIRDEEPPDAWYQYHTRTMVMSLNSFKAKYNTEPFVGLIIKKGDENG